MHYRYYLCDVFTDVRFGGNQLAVLPQAEGLSDQQMQQIAREFNFSETTFVLPPEKGHSRKVRIFTPANEVPFAGHPNIGTAFVLASAGEFGEITSSQTVTFEEEAGTVAVSIQRRGDGGLWCELAAPQSLSLGQSVPVESVSSAVSIAPGDIVTDTHPPRVASVGLPFILAELQDREALAAAGAVTDRFEDLGRSAGVTPDVLLYVRSSDAFDIRARMFAPLDGVPEDPATGSANCALAGLLSHYSETDTGNFHWRIAQGVEMGRPSVLEARSRKNAGGVTDIWIGGSSVLVAEGMITVDAG